MSGSAYLERGQPVGMRWIEPTNSVNGLPDLVDEAGMILGYVGAITTGFRGYAIERRPGRRATFSAMADHSTEAAARAWVEAKVAALAILAQEAET